MANVKVIVYQDLNPLSSTFSQFQEVQTIFNCDKQCPPISSDVIWIPMLHEWEDEEALSWSNTDGEYHKWPTPIFYNLSGREVYIDWGDGSDIEKSKAVAVKHRYTTRGTFTPMIGFDSDPIWDFTYKYDGADDYTIIAPVLVEDWTGKDITYLRAGYYKKYIPLRDMNKWQVIIANGVIEKTKPLYIFPNDRNGDFEWRYLTTDEGRDYTNFTMYMSDSVLTSLNRNPFIIYNYDDGTGSFNTIKQYPFFNRSIDNTAVQLDGNTLPTELAQLTSDYFVPYGEVLNTGASKQWKFKNCKNFLDYNEGDHTLNFKIATSSRVPIRDLKVIIEFPNSRVERYTSFSDVTTTVGIQDIEDFTVTAFYDEVYGYDVNFDLILNTRTNKIEGIRVDM